MKRFVCYRPHPPQEYYEQGAANQPDEPQFEGVVFSDGTRFEWPDGEAE